MKKNQERNIELGIMQVFESNIEIKRWRNYFENTNIIFKDIVEKLKKKKHNIRTGYMQVGKQNIEIGLWGKYFKKI